MRARASFSQRMEDLRMVLLGLSEGGKREVSNKALFEVLGLTNEAEKARVRRAMQEMLGRGEVARVRDGVYRYTPQDDPVKNFAALRKLWRAIRAAKPGWTVADVVLVSGTWEKAAREYVNWLLEEGYALRHGKAGNTLKYRTSKRGAETRDTPVPPREIKDPYVREKNAALGVLQAMLTRDLDRPAVRAKVVEGCKAILAKFEKEEVADHEDA